jgi:hypothetical protein
MRFLFKPQQLNCTLVGSGTLIEDRCSVADQTLKSAECDLSKSITIMGQFDPSGQLCCILPAVRKKHNLPFYIGRKFTKYRICQKLHYSLEARAEIPDGGFDSAVDPVCTAMRTLRSKCIRFVWSAKHVSRSGALL